MVARRRNTNDLLNECLECGGYEGPSETCPNCGAATCPIDASDFQQQNNSEQYQEDELAAVGGDIDMMDDFDYIDPDTDDFVFEPV